MSWALTLRATEREAYLWSRLWWTGVFSAFIAPVLVLAALGVGLGGLVDDGSQTLRGLDYLVFVTPGLLVASAVQTAAGNSMWPVMAGHRWLGFHYAQVASPLSAADVYGGQVVWTAARAFIQATVFVAAGAALGGVESWWALAAVPAAALTATAFGAVLAAFAATQDSDAAFDVILCILIVPLYLFSGTVFPIEQLPQGLRLLVQLFPMWHGVELARGATTGSIDAWPAVGHVAVLLTYTAAGWWWGVRAFARRLTA
jgi:lipooligosaccharide transport system permease protein